MTDGRKAHPAVYSSPSSEDRELLNQPKRKIIRTRKCHKGSKFASPFPSHLKESPRNSLTYHQALNHPGPLSKSIDLNLDPIGSAFLGHGCWWTWVITLRSTDCMTEATVPGKKIFDHCLHEVYSLGFRLLQASGSKQESREREITVLECVGLLCTAI